MLSLLPSDAPPSAAVVAAAPSPASRRRSTRSAVAKPEASAFGRLRANVGAFVDNFASAFRSARAAEALLFRLAYAFLMRATYSLHTLYEQQRWQLEPATVGYLSTYRTALGLAVNTLLIGPLSRVLSEADLLLLALACSAANATFEASHATLALYTFVNMPASSVCGALTQTGLSSLFSKAIKTSDAGAALSVLDVLNSAVGVLAPMYGGLLLHHVGVGMQPHVSAAHYVLLFALAAATIARQRFAKADAKPTLKKA